MLEELLSYGLGAKTVDVLQKHGIDSLQKLNQLSDEELLALKGIGRRRLKEIRDALARISPQKEEKKTSKESKKMPAKTKVRVVALVNLQDGWHIYPKGTVFEVDWKWAQREIKRKTVKLAE